MNFPENLKYTKEHEWILVEGNIGTVGVTEYAQGELGDVVFIDINKDAVEVTPGLSLGTIEAVKTVSELYSPVTGKVVEVNEELTSSPELVNQEPYGKGWFVKIELTNPSELDELLDSAAYQALIGQ